MKTRAGFVSNSSSSSFCIMGIAIDNSECGDDGSYEKFDFKLDEFREYFKKERVEGELGVESIDDLSDIEILEASASHELIPDGFEYFEIQQGIEDYKGKLVLGFDIDMIREDETKHEFKSRVCEMLRRIGFKGDENDIEIIRDQGYLG